MRNRDTTGKPQKMDGKPQAGVSMTDTWLRKHRLTYTGATRHPFILSIRDGTVDLSAFKRWLGQDYIFVRAFVPFVASVLIKAWKNSDHESGDIEWVLGGVAALNDEIEWFKQEASKWGVELSGVVPEKTTQDYCRKLSSRLQFTETKHANQNSKTKRIDETTPAAASSDPEETTAPNRNSNSPEGPTPPAAGSDPGRIDFNFRENEISNNKADTVGIFNFGNNKTGGSNDSKIRRFNFEGNKIQKNDAKNVCGFCDFGNEY